MIKTGYFKSNANSLYYECVIPHRDTKKTGLIFVHASGGNRLGPHRLFVELARNFNSIGLPTMRFDLSSCGDSTGENSRSSIKQDVSDCLSAVDFFIQLANLQTVSLFAISRGAYVCFSAITNHTLEVSTAILLSTPAPTAGAAAKSFSFRLKEYFHKLEDPKALRKFLTGRANVAGIIKTLTTALNLNRRYATVHKKGGSKCPLLFIYGEKDPIASESIKYYENLCKVEKRSFQCKIIENANHSFFHYKWKQQISDISAEWMRNIIERKENRK